MTRMLTTFAAALLGLALGRATAAEPLDVKDGTVRGELGKKLDEHMTKAADKGFSGVALAVHKGEVVLARGYGLADREKKIPFTTETVFDVGSITKQFTGAAVLRLEADGKLKVTDPITTYFKDVPEDTKGVTLHHLLTHTAGFADSLGGDYNRVGRDDFVKLALESKLKSAPGKTYRYSNVGYSLLGAIVEQVSGQSYEAYLHDKLFKPAGMTRTGYLGPKWGKDELARGYRKDKDWGTPRDHAWAEDGPYWHLRANGGLLSTVGDLYRWHAALEGEQVLPKGAKEKYVTPHVKESFPNTSHYGYGWVVERTPRGTRLIQHDGGNGVFFADFKRWVDEDAVLIVATNAAEKADSSLPDRLAGIIFPDKKP